uniref:Uncharacterized protein n=1 Tax=Cacopsylla melanoneura TaxID=428564 RepID=A0A8D8REF5_9HEMI
MLMKDVKMWFAIEASSQPLFFPWPIFHISLLPKFPSLPQSLCLCFFYLLCSPLSPSPTYLTHPYESYSLLLSPNPTTTSHPYESYLLPHTLLSLSSLTRERSLME